MPDLFKQEMPPEIIKATDELRQRMGAQHTAAIKSGSVWASIRQAVNKAQSAGSIKEYMEFLLETREWDGDEELRQRLRLHLDGGRIANWQLIAREHAAGIDYYVFATLRDLIKDKDHWGLGLTEAQLKAYVEPEEPALWARIEAAIHYGQAAGRKPDGEMSNKNVGDLGAERVQQDRARALGRAMERAEVEELHNEGLLPKTTAALFGQKAKDESYEQLKEECLATAHQALTTARDAMAGQSMTEQNKTYKATQKAVREAMEPLKRWKPKPLGPAEADGWAEQAAALLLQSYTTDAVRVLIAEIELRLEGSDV